MKAGTSLWTPMTIRLNGTEVARLNPDGSVWGDWPVLEGLATPLTPPTKEGGFVSGDSVACIALFLLACRSGRWAQKPQFERLSPPRAFLWAETVQIAFNAQASFETMVIDPLGDIIAKDNGEPA